MNTHEVFIHIHQGCFAGTGAIVRLPQCQWGKPVGYGKISQCITTTKHSEAKTVCIFLGIYCIVYHNKTHRNTNRVHAFWTYFKIKYKKWILAAALKQNIWFHMKVLSRISRRSLVKKCWHKKYLTSLLGIFWVQNQTVHYVHHQIEISYFDILGLRTPTICIGILQLHYFR